MCVCTYAESAIHQNISNWRYNQLFGSKSLSVWPFLYNGCLLGLNQKRQLIHFVIEICSKIAESILPVFLHIHNDSSSINLSEDWCVVKQKAFLSYSNLITCY